MSNRFRLLLSLAWRNLGRNPRRTLITGTGIALGVGMWKLNQMGLLPYVLHQVLDAS